MRRKRKPLGQVKLSRPQGEGTRILYQTKGRQKNRLTRHITEEIE